MADAGEPAAALAGVRVLDLSRVLAGPWCTQTLADLGADVIKVERPGSGDDTRGWGPPFVGGDGDAAYFLCANRNKRSITVDLRHPDGQALVRRLALRCDVVVENFKPGDLARYGLDAASLRAADPRLIHCAITGYGQTGPYADRAGYDFAVQGLGGLMSVTGPADGEAGAAPYKAGVAVADLFAGQNAVVAILAALRHRDATGQGQVIDIALLDSQVAMLANLASQHLVGGEVPRRLGNGHPSIVPYQSFEASDGPLIVAVGNDRQFARLCELLDCAELAQDPRYASNAGRVRGREALVPELARRLARRDRAHWLGALRAAGIPCGPINDIGETFADPQVRARGMVETLPHPRHPALPLVASPLKLSATPATCRRAPPLLGQHTDEVLRECGLDAQAIAALRRDGVV